MTAADLSLLLGVLAVACVSAAVPAHRAGGLARDIRLMLGIGGVLAAAAAALQLA